MELAIERPRPRTRAGVALLVGGGLMLAAGVAAPAASAAVPTSPTTITTSNGKCLEIRSNARTNGTVVQQQSCNGSAAQQWQISATSSGYSKIVVAGTSLALDVKDVSSADGAALQVWGYGGGANQQWKVRENADGTVNLITRMSGAKCADLTGGSTADGKAMQMWTCYTGSANQAFKLAGGSTTTPPTNPPAPNYPGLDTAEKKRIAQSIVSTAENSTLRTDQCYKYIEDIGDNRGYTGGIIGFTSGTHDMLKVVKLYDSRKPNNGLSEFIPALQRISDAGGMNPDTSGLGQKFLDKWREAAINDSVFRGAQDSVRDSDYFNPAVSKGKSDGLSTLGQFIYYDAIVMHGPGSAGDGSSFDYIRAQAAKGFSLPLKAGSDQEKAYLNKFLDVRTDVMGQEAAHEDVTRLNDTQRKFLKEGNLDLHEPLTFSVYGQQFVLNGANSSPTDAGQCI